MSTLERVKTFNYACACSDDSHTSFHPAKPKPTQLFAIKCPHSPKTLLFCQTERVHYVMATEQQTLLGMAETKAQALC